MFEGVVRGFYTRGPWETLGGVVVEVGPDIEIPLRLAVRALHNVVRGDGLKVGRAVVCVGDWRQCENVAEALLDQRVSVDWDEMGMAVITPLEEEVEE
jgi:hypothetical protein